MLYSVLGGISKPIFISALFTKILAGLLYGLIYTYYYEQAGDSFYIFNNSVKLTQILYESFYKYFDYLFLHEYTIQDSPWIGGYTMPRAFMMVKLTSVLNIFTGSNYWINGMWLSFYSFFGFYYFVVTLIKLYPNLKISIIISFLFYPSVIFWSSGLTKEAVVMPGLLITLAYFVDFNLKSLKYLPMVVAVLILSLYIKFYYGAILMPFLGFYLLLKKFGTKITAVLIVFIFLLISVCIYFYVDFFESKFLPYILYSHNPNYGNIGIRNIDSLMLIRYNSLTTDIFSFIINLPKAVVYMSYAPIVGLNNNVIQTIETISNTFLLLLTLITFQNLVLNRNHPINFLTILLLGYIFILGVFLAFCAPNLGTLARYKIGYQPFFILLLLVGSGIDRISSRKNLNN